MEGATLPIGTAVALGGIGYLVYSMFSTPPVSDAKTEPQKVEKVDKEKDKHTIKGGNGLHNVQSLGTPISHTANPTKTDMESFEYLKQDIRNAGGADLAMIEIMRDYLRQQGIEPPLVTPGTDLVDYQARLTLMQQSTALYFRVSRDDGKELDIFPLGTVENAMQRRGMQAAFNETPLTFDYSRDHIK